VLTGFFYFESGKQNPNTRSAVVRFRLPTIKSSICGHALHIYLFPADAAQNKKDFYRIKLCSFHFFVSKDDHHS